MGTAQQGGVKASLNCRHITLDLISLQCPYLSRDFIYSLLVSSSIPLVAWGARQASIETMIARMAVNIGAKIFT
jgi:hypothetical protein